MHNQLLLSSLSQPVSNVLLICLLSVKWPLTTLFDTSFLSKVDRKVLNCDGNWLEHEEHKLVLDTGVIRCVERPNMMNQSGNEKAVVELQIA